MRHALRTLSREKAFAAFAILTLALGIGAVTTIFSVVDSVLLKPLAYKEPARLYAAAESAPSKSKRAATYPVRMTPKTGDLDVSQGVQGPPGWLDGGDIRGDCRQVPEVPIAAIH